MMLKKRWVLSARSLSKKENEERNRDQTKKLFSFWRQPAADIESFCRDIFFPSVVQFPLLSLFIIQLQPLAKLRSVHLNCFLDFVHYKFSFDSHLSTNKINKETQVAFRKRQVDSNPQSFTQWFTRERIITKRISLITSWVIDWLSYVRVVVVWE